MRRSGMPRLLTVGLAIAVVACGGPRSSTCRATELGASGEVDVTIANEATEQWCRAKYVVESYDVIG